MNRFTTSLNAILLKISIVIAIFLHTITGNAQVKEIPKYNPVDKTIQTEIEKMDSLYFHAYNTCNMKVQAEIFNNDIEFFHDKGGLMTSKKELLASIKKNICGKVTRTLIKGSIEVYPIHNYGAVEIGYHKFFNNREPNAKSIPSKFIIMWKKDKTSWTMTKVISLH